MHGHQDLGALEGDRLERGADEVGPGRAASDADDRAVGNIFVDTVYERICICWSRHIELIDIVHVDRERGPYALAMVDFEPGVRAFGPMVYEEGKEPPLGATMQVIHHSLPDGSPDYAFQEVAGVTP